MADFIFMFVFGLIIGILGVLICQKSHIQKKKYGFSEKSTFDYNEHIRKDILEYDLDLHHLGEEREDDYYD